MRKKIQVQERRKLERERVKESKRKAEKCENRVEVTLRERERETDITKEKMLSKMEWRSGKKSRRLLREEKERKKGIGENKRSISQR